MPDEKISELDEAVNLVGAIFPGVQGGINKYFPSELWTDIFYTKTEVDGFFTGLGSNTSFTTVRVATVANITIATALNNGDTLDGVVLATGDLVLVKDQTASEENGIYEVGVAPVRAVFFDAFNDYPGAQINVQEGTVNADTSYICVSNRGGTLNVSAIDFQNVTTVLGIDAINSTLNDVFPDDHSIYDKAGHPMLYWPPDLHDSVVVVGGDGGRNLVHTHVGPPDNYDGLYSVIIGSRNVRYGVSVSYLVSIGFETLENIVGGERITAVGEATGQQLRSALHEVMLGTKAGLGAQYNGTTVLGTGRARNVWIGSHSAINVKDNVTDTTVVGYNGLNSSGGFAGGFVNAIGSNAATSAISIINCQLMGYNVAPDAVSSSGLIIIGHNTGQGIVTANNATVILNSWVAPDDVVPANLMLLGAGTSRRIWSTPTSTKFMASAQAAGDVPLFEIINNIVSPVNYARFTPAATAGNVLLDLGFGTDAQVDFKIRARKSSAQVDVIVGGADGIAVRGNQTNAAIAAGNIGETMESTVATGSSVAMTTGVAKDITTLSLTAGSWKLTGTIRLNPAATTSLTRWIASLSATLDTLDQTTGGCAANALSAAIVPGGDNQISINVGPTTKRVSSTTTMHLVGFAVFTVSTLGMYGYMRAERIG